MMLDILNRTLLARHLRTYPWNFDLPLSAEAEQHSAVGVKCATRNRGFLVFQVNS